MKFGIFFKTFISVLLVGVVPLILFYFLAVISYREFEKFIPQIEPLFPELAKRMAEIYQNIGIQVILVFLFALVVIVFYSLIYTRSLTNVLNKLIKGSEKIAKGDYDIRVDIKTGDELEKLGDAFNKMAQELKAKTEAIEEEKLSLEIKVKARTRELEELAKTLEEKVRERTKELQKRVEELEKFQKLTVGRELRMVELKKEIENLKKELQKYERKEK